MGGCLVWNISLVTYRMHRLRAFYRSKGLVSRYIRLENGTTIRCWVHLRDSSQRRKWGGDKNKGKPNPHPTVKPLEERKAVLFLHGFAEDGTAAFEHQVAAFSKEYRVYIPDLIYFGSSSTTNQSRTEVFQADCMHDLLIKLNVKEAHVVGIDYGGLVAFWMAHKYPEMVRKLVLCSSGICQTPHTYDSLLRSLEMNRVDEILLPTTCDGLKLTYSLLYSKPVHLPDFILQQLLDFFYSVSLRPRRVQLLEHQVIGSENCPHLPTLRQEVLIIWGREDKIFKLDLAYQLRQHLGPNNAKLVILDGCGHMPHAEKHKDFNAIVSEFLDDSVPDDMYMYPDIKSKAR
ncbi:hypothetical protein MPTK1_5g21870 [Marchantia polymorpha subsp. ruderalis]|uniref:AB hydrolase-1 domain-containing protein n=2 Tax=Marchantia polymorpha TaxID=3197 RepID=A0A176WF50_MARPO|nr:hypothetical protein AXG93_3943s1360 [Marchantia polymorpha subsp. ruderalis]PTQ31810.1 hypothetical protein MARPO_0106s0012 [Marchantia polymorpha]BBN12659.1 hypothetical protein Mp_5g21870 [Marchantia polymorpha subsp. ruderalis]|eukprot:PTQ31810.1 hypothetical protein MARPO_0106s0012 [Marchantia polymorpha]